MPLPPKPPDEPGDDDEDPPVPLLPEPEEPDELDDTPALPREPAEVLPALRRAVLELVLLDTDEILLPADAALTAPATAADFAVAAPVCADAVEADLFVAATPPPVPEPCPETAEREASRAVLREAACWEAIVEGL